MDENNINEDGIVGAGELVEAHKGRAAQYGLLSRLFRAEIDADLLQRLHDARYQVSTGNKNVDEGHRLIATYLSGIWDNTVTELAADYMRVFFGHGYSGHSAAYPFESVYASEKRLLMADARDEVLALYRAAGLDKNPSWKESEDHVALELEYMQVLAQRTVESMCAGEGRRTDKLLKSQRNFLEDHLGAWIPLLAADMRKYAQTGFYQGLSHLAEGFVETDGEMLVDLLRVKR